MKVKFLFILPLVVVVGFLWSTIISLSPPDGTSLLISNEVPKQVETAVEIRKSDEAFQKMMDVVTHPRCINCHPSDNVPKQGMDGHPHYFGMARGQDDHGFQATQCATCHQSENNEYSGVPGAPHWALAPASMGWEGLNRKEIAEKMLNLETNGGKNHRELVKHMTEDELVLWAWNPGVDAKGDHREIPPVSEEEFKKAVEQWFAEGAVVLAE